MKAQHSFKYFFGVYFHTYRYEYLMEEKQIPFYAILYKGNNLFINQHISNSKIIDDHCIEVEIYIEEKQKYIYLWVDCENNDVIRIEPAESAIVKDYADQAKLEIKHFNDTNEIEKELEKTSGIVLD